MEIRWSVPAAEDLELICERIEIDDQEAARRVARRIYEGCARLKDFPALGRTSIRIARAAGISIRATTLHRRLRGSR